MKINFFDSWNKFSQPIREHWEELGHEVRFDPLWDKLYDGDINFFYQADQTVIEALKRPHKGKVYVQCVDVEVWTGFADQIDWNKVDGVIFMAKHIQDKIKPILPPNLKTVLIKPGIDLNKFTL